MFIDERAKIERFWLVGEDVVEHEFARPRIDGAEDEAENAEENQREDVSLVFAERAQIALQIIRERFFARAITWHGWRAAEAAVMAAKATAHAAAETAAVMAAEAAPHAAARPARDGTFWAFLPEEAALFSVFLVS